MRASSYLLTFMGLLGSVTLNVLSIVKPDWLSLRSPDIFHSRVTVRYGLFERCDLSVIDIPGGKGKYIDYNCRPFPSYEYDQCNEKNQVFCFLWVAARYAALLGAAFGFVALLAVVLGIPTRATRRTAWKVVAFFTLCSGLMQVVAFGIVTDAYKNVRYEPFEYSRLGTSYILSAVSWILAKFIAFGLLVAGLSAEAGHEWAAGPRAYMPING